MNEPTRCELCGEPMPPGEQMFKYHGYSGPCPTPRAPVSTPPQTEPRTKVCPVCKAVTMVSGPNSAHVCEKDETPLRGHFGTPPQEPRRNTKSENLGSSLVEAPAKVDELEERLLEFVREEMWQGRLNLTEPRRHAYEITMGVLPFVAKEHAAALAMEKRLETQVEVNIHLSKENERLSGVVRSLSSTAQEKEK